MKKIALYIAGLATGVIALFGVATVLANPSYFAPSTSTGTATTTVTTITPGAATTTLIHDSFYQGNNTAVDSLALMMQVKASTSASVVDYSVSYSMDGIDYYEADLIPSSVVFGQSRIDHASSTITERWAAGSATASTTRKLVNIPAPLRYTKITFTNPAGVSPTNLLLWASLQPIKERAEN